MDETKDKPNEKWFNKKVNIFGKTVSMFIVIALVLVGTGTAALVGYLSNTVSASVTVTSPMELMIGIDPSDLWYGPQELGSIIGGETIEFYVSTENKANAPITGTMWNVVSNPGGVACADFAYHEARVLDGDGVTELYPFAPIGCEPINLTSVRFITTPTEPWTWAANHYDIAHIKVTFEEAAFGTYSVSTYVKP